MATDPRQQNEQVASLEVRRCDFSAQGFRVIAPKLGSREALLEPPALIQRLVPSQGAPRMQSPVA